MTKKRSVLPDSYLITSILSTVIIVFIILSMRYPSLVLYEEVDVSGPTEIEYSENLLPPVNVRFWCEEGLEWATLVEGRPVAFKNVGIIMDGKYEGHCHAASQPDSGIELYFNNKGSGFLIKQSDGEIAEIPFSN